MDNVDSDNRFYTRNGTSVYPRGKDPSHWERNFDEACVVQSGPAKDLLLRMRQCPPAGATPATAIPITTRFG